MAEPFHRVTILYVGPLDAGGTCRSRMESLRELGHEVIPIDTHAYISSWHKLVRVIQNRLLMGPGVISVNKAVLIAARVRRPDVLWIDKGIYVWPETLRRVKQEVGAFIMHYNTDDIKNPRHNFRLYLGAIRLYDAHFTSNRFNVDELRAMGAKYVGISELGFDHRVFRRMELAPGDRRRWNADVFFIGHWEPETERLVRVLSEAGINVAVRGPGWEKVGQRLPSGTLRGGPVYGEAYARAINAGRIGLGFMSKWNRNETAGRIFEIPACGTFLLAERNPTTRQLYSEGQEVELFSTEAELVAKTREYLTDAGALRRVAEAGRIRCLKASYSWKDRVERLLGEIKPYIS